MFKKQKPLSIHDNFQTYRRVHERNIIDDTQCRVKRDVIYEYDSWKTHKGEYLRNTWIEIYPWEKFESLLSNNCVYVRLNEQYFLDQKSFDVNKPRDLNIFDFIKKMVDKEPHKSGFTKFMDRVFGGKSATTTYFEDEQNRIAKLLKDGEVGVEKPKESVSPPDQKQHDGT